MNTHTHTHTHTYTYRCSPICPGITLTRTDMSRYHTYTYRCTPICPGIHRYILVYTGSFNKTLEGDIEMPSLDSDKALAVELKVSATYRIPVSPTYIGHRYLSHIDSDKALAVELQEN